MLSNGRIRIFTWHVHGSYLYYLSQGNYDIYIPVKPANEEGYHGRGETFPFGEHVYELDAAQVKEQEFDCIIFQSRANYLTDQFEILSDEQRRLPRVYVEHDPPTGHPTNTKHVVDDAEVLLVHVTHFNRLMWDNNATSTRVIEHGVAVPDVPYTGELDKGIVVINNLPTRGRLLGLDLFLEVRKHIPLDLIGMGTETLGLGEVLHPQLPQFISRYRFFFNPIRYTSHGLAVCEAMMLGIPVVALATTEMPVVIDHAVNGYIHTSPDELIKSMRLLLDDPGLAMKTGREGRKTALERYNISRFVADWEQTFAEVIAKHNIKKPAMIT